MHLATLIVSMGDLGMTAPAVWAWFASSWEEFVRTAGTTLVTSIWQGAVIICGLEICLRVMPRMSATHRFVIWIAGFGIAAGLPLAGLPLLSLLHFRASTAGTGAADAGVAGSTTGPLLQLDARWGLAIAGLWVVALAVRGVGLAVHSMRLRRLWKTAQPVEVSATLAAALRNVRGGRVTICTTEMLDRPSVIGFLAPRILIPAWLMVRLTPGELEQIVLHEAEHLRRRDDWTNLAQKLALVAFPLNPALAWIEHRLCREREMACDDGVVRITRAPRAYAACLASLAERGLERRAEALSLGAWHRRSELVHRVHGILLRKRGMSKAAAVALLGAVGCALVAGSIEMARCPQLVAFVPEQKSLAMTTERQREMTAMLARENAETKMSLPTGFHAVQARAVIPPLRPALNTSQHRAQKSEAAVAAKAVAKVDAQQVAKTEVAGDRASPSGEQQWVVLAAWEDVQTVSRTSNTVSDYEASGATTGAMSDGATSAQQKNDRAAGQTASKDSSGSSTQANSQYTITRLILRVIPVNSNSNSTQPTTGSVRGGWFVIQL